MTDVKNKTIFITGGAEGIGLATAKKLLNEGANVVIYSKDAEKIKNEKLPPEKTLIIEGDVRKRNEVKKSMAAAIKKFGSLDVLINNAGVAKRENFLETEEKDWDFIFDVNVKGVFICTQEFVNSGKETGNSKQEKLVVNIASGVGIYGSAGLAVYSASKAAVINISQSLNDELKDTGISFVAVCPGSTDTKMFRNLFPTRRAHHTSEQVAEVIYKTIIGEIKPDDRLIVDVFEHAR